MGNGSPISVARPRWRLRENLPQKTICYGNQGQTHLSEIALAEWLCGACHRAVRGSSRRDLLDHVIVVGEPHLRRLLRDYADYDNDYRTHLGLDKETPLGGPVHDHGTIKPVPKLDGLHHAYVRI